MLRRSTTRPRFGCAPATTRRSREALRALFVTYRSRTFVGLTLMAAQAFFYNAIFFTYALVLTKFYGVRPRHVGWYILPFAVGNFLGPVVARPAVRYARAARDDRRDLRRVGRAAVAVGRSVRARHADRRSRRRSAG